jgi:hypothetical protein
VYAITWVKCENIVVSERNQSQRPHKVFGISLKFQNRQIHRDREQITGCPGEGVGSVEWMKIVRVIKIFKS